MRIICRHCNKLTKTKGRPEHFVCDCKKTLIFFGEQLGCDILENENVYPKNHVNNIFKKNRGEISPDERRLYFDQKYPVKQ